MLAPWKKSYDQPRQHVKKQRHTLSKKVCLVKAMVFPVVMYGCENWMIKKAEKREFQKKKKKKAEHRRNDVLNCGVEEDS